jgi:hypothetical protein
LHTAVCGWDGRQKTGAHNKGVQYDPDPWDENLDPLYGEVINTCPYNNCLADGTPVVDLMVVAAADGSASGGVESSPPGISLAGAGTGQWGWEVETAVTLTATPGACSCAAFTGDCVATGSQGAPLTCSVIMDPARKPFPLPSKDVQVAFGFCDTTPPAISAAVATPAVLWPPNHKMAEVHVEVAATDDCGPAPACRIVSVSSNEPANSTGDGQTEKDWEITPDLQVQLRKERAGGGHGRTYTIDVACTDASHNTSTASATVVVPLDG